LDHDGDKWLSRYTLKKRLGQGGMGVAYLVEDTAQDNALCVLKQLSINEATPEEHEEAARFFKREVDILRRLKHPGVVKLFDAYVTEDRNYFLVMDYINGHNLEEVIKTWGTLSSEATIEIGLQCCEILEYLHEHKPSIVYRDLKPSNVMLTPEGQIVFIDFGIARSILPAQPATRVVTTGYSPPEQYFGRPEPRSDLYALGATLGQLLTGVRPKPLTVSTPMQLNRDVMHSLDDLIRRLTAHSPDDRPPSARAVCYELYRIYHEIHPDFAVPEQALPANRNFAPSGSKISVGDRGEAGLDQLNRIMQEKANLIEQRARKGTNKMNQTAKLPAMNTNSSRSPIWQGIMRLLHLLRP